MLYGRHVAGRIQPCYMGGNRGRLRPARKTNPQAPPETRLDADVSLCSHRARPSVHFEHREWKKRTLSQIIGDNRAWVRDVAGSTHARRVAAACPQPEKPARKIWTTNFGAAIGGRRSRPRKGRWHPFPREAEAIRAGTPMWVPFHRDAASLYSGLR